MHRYSNGPIVRSVENEVVKAVRSGQTVEYAVDVVYEAGRKTRFPKGSGSEQPKMEVSVLRDMS